MSEEKKVSTTEQFKQHLAKIVYQETGFRVSKDKAWKLFKAIVNGTVQFVLKLDGNKLSLAGIGKFEVVKSAARGKKAGLDKDGNPDPNLKVWPFVPRFRFRPSTAVVANVEKFFDLGDHDDVVLKDYGIFAADAEPVEEAPAEASFEVPTPAPQMTVDDDFFNL